MKPICEAVGYIADCANTYIGSAYGSIDDGTSAMFGTAWLFLAYVVILRTRTKRNVAGAVTKVREGNGG